ncbi:MAG: hypothetical protein QXS42_02890 [Zestosphaera sp.]
MRARYVDLSNKIPSESLTQLTEKANAYGYGAVALHGLTKVRTAGNVVLIPKRALNLEAPSRREEGRAFKVLVARTPGELKLSNRIIKSIDAVEIGHTLLTNGRVKKTFTKLVNVGKPVVINASEIMDALLMGRDLPGLHVLLGLYEKSSLLLSLGSGARTLSEMHHPSVYYALLLELGLSEAKSLSALTTNPLSVLRSAGLSPNV